MEKITQILLLLCVGLSVSTLADLQKRIIGGQPCVRPYHVRLFSTNAAGDVLLCGGSLIHQQWILTAAHCKEQRIEAYLPGIGVEINEPPVIFKRFLLKHDIMLLKLPSPVTNTPIALPDCKNPPQIGDSVNIAGYGPTAPGIDGKKASGPLPTVLHCANINVADCLGVSGKINKIKNFLQHWFCAETHGVDTCPGDSGGGVVFKNMIYGVHSRGGVYPCARPAQFVDVCKYMDWIRKTINGP